MKALDKIVDKITAKRGMGVVKTIISKIIKKFDRWSLWVVKTILITIYYF